MKIAKVKKEVSLFLVLALFFAVLTGCTDISTIRIQEDGSGSYAETFSVSKKLWDMVYAGLGNDDMVKQTLEDAYPGATATVEDGVVEGVETKNLKLAMDFTGIEGLQTLLNSMGMYSMQYNEKYFSRSMIVTPGDGASDGADSMFDGLEGVLGENEELLNLLTDEMKNMEVRMTIAFPYAVIDTNGVVQEDGKTVVWDGKQESQDSSPRMYASFAKQDSKQAPKFDGVKSGKSYNTAVAVKVVSDNLLDYVAVDGEKYESDYLSISEEGVYQVVAVDKNKNQKTVKFRVDMTKPQVKGIKNNKTYKRAVVVKFSDKGSGMKKATLNGKKVSSGVKVSKKGSYTLKVTDRAGNSKTVKFKIS